MIDKPIVLAHASHRGDDALQQLRIVLATISTRFTDKIFLRFHLMKLSPGEISDLLSQTVHKDEILRFLREFAAYCAG